MTMGTNGARRARLHDKIGDGVSALWYHVMLGTNQAQPLPDGELRTKLHGVLAEAITAAGGELVAIGGAADHVHLLIGAFPGTAPSSIAELARRRSEEWLTARTQGGAPFAWEPTWWVFSVSASVLTALAAYIDLQDAHHAACTFEEERNELIGHQQHGCRELLTD